MLATCRPTLTALALAAVVLGTADLASAAPKTSDDYRYFRALSIDLQGRIPTRAELTAFEANGFSVDAWIEAHLGSATYAERIRRIYMDLMRLEESGTFQFVPSPVYLRRIQVLDAKGRPVWVYYRLGQRRLRDATDGIFCFTAAESGLTFNGVQPAVGTPTPIDQPTIDANTVTVKPWWLYKDYAATTPSLRYGATWTDAPSGFRPVADLLTEPDGSPTTEIRICKEEAQTPAMGTVYASGRKTAPPAGTPPPYGRYTQLPLDSYYAQKHAGAPISCIGAMGAQNSADCGCGVGLERCSPGTSTALDPSAFSMATHNNLGESQPLDVSNQTAGTWNRHWWSREAQNFLDDIFLNDRDVREVLTSHATMVNGPLAQFYRSTAPATMPTSASTFGYDEPQGLLLDTALPAGLQPFETDRWVRIDDRGPNASGLLTMPIFLTKFGSRRGRAHVLYNAFMCRDFVAGNVMLTPSTEPNLTIRPGCSTCHSTLEPLSAYFSRVVESDWTFLPPAQFPLSATSCFAGDITKMSRSCQTFYDPAFTTASQSLLRGSYSAPTHADAGPAGIATYLTGTPEFPMCVASNVASSFLGRALNSDDVALQTSLSATLTSTGYSMKALVRALVKAEAYRHSNNLSSSSWRAAGGAP